MRTKQVQMSYGAIKQLEIDLKNQMAKEFASIQKKRAVGETPNQGTVDRYKDHAQALRGVLEAKHRQSYNPLRDITCYPNDLYNSEQWDFEGHRTVLEVVRSLHETGNPATVV